MIRSMTAFAREALVTDQGALTIELRSVNHRYLDCTFKLAESLRHLEPKLRDCAGKKLARGKLDCLIRLQPENNSRPSLEIDEEHLEQLLHSAAKIAARLPESQPLAPLAVLQFPGICRQNDTSDAHLISATESLFAQALSTLADNRAREGEKLAEMVQTRLALVEIELGNTRSALPALLSKQRERVIARITELGIDTDHNRLEQELVHLAQKADVEEELDRLDAHIEEVRRVLKEGGACGRRLDFLMQELNREANTLASKSLSSTTTQSSIELKVLIEQMREQIQNIE
ncbi:UNVERIFIED_CONTAM: hypothetical protein GTU68_058359 [Idotea baltica]|nr:hypothetical protein [Idotea baltica]